MGLPAERRTGRMRAGREWRGSNRGSDVQQGEPGLKARARSFATFSDKVYRIGTPPPSEPVAPL
jgi:hypothetical protein